MPDKYIADAKERAERAELRDWGTDDAAWKTAQKRDELKYYEHSTFKTQCSKN